MAKIGRPTKYDARYHIPWAKSLARKGLTIDEIADAMEVAKSTIYEWAKKHEEFSDALTRARSEADAMVEDSLFSRAMGQTVRETKKYVSYDQNGSPIPTRVEQVDREVPPDVTACIFWLKNRQPQLWRDRQDIAINEKQDADIKEWIDALGLGDDK